MAFLVGIKKPAHQQIYFWTLVAIAVSLPTSKALMSIFPFVLLINWLWEGRLKEKLRMWFSNPSVWLLNSVFGLYLLGLLWTDSLKWGIHDLKIQIPLLIFPLVIGTSMQLNFRQVKTILLFFSAAVVFCEFLQPVCLAGFFRH